MVASEGIRRNQEGAGTPDTLGTVGRTAFRLGLLVIFLWGSLLEAQPGLRRYVVELRDEAVIPHLLRQTRGSKGKMQLATEDASHYRSYLRAKQAALIRQIESMPGAKVLAQVDTVFNGVMVALEPEDAESLRQYPEVEDVIPSISYHKMLDAALPLVKVPAAWEDFRIGGEQNAGASVKIAIIDTGIDVTHPMLDDPSLTRPPGFPKFTAPMSPTQACPNGVLSDERFTNSKVVVARNYVSLLSNPDPNCDAEDRDGHGTFNAAIAAGRRVAAPLASIAGAAPKAFLGSYKVFGTPGANDVASLEAILKAIDDAVNDGMDIINVSLGAATESVPANDPLAQAVEAAVAKGVTVVVAAGNTGPGTGTISSPGIAPSAITVGSTTNGRIFAHPLSLSGTVPVPPELQTLAAVPGNGPAITSSIGPALLFDVALLDSSGLACSPLPPSSLSNTIGLIQRGGCNFSVKVRNAFQSGALVAVIYNNQPNRPALRMGVGDATQIPAVMIGNPEGEALKAFMATAGAAIQGTLGAQLQAISMQPHRLADFSANGPSTDFGIKPDLVAPGTQIYSATQNRNSLGEQYDASGFFTGSGTSFSAPIVAGAAALLKQAKPGSTPAQIKSALVNTAAQVVSSFQGSSVGVLEQGNGLLDVAAALNTPATVSPVSISFGANPPGSRLITSTNLSVTNAGSGSETFVVSAVRTAGSENFTLSAVPARFDLAEGATTTVAVNAVATQPLTGTVEGYLAIQGQNSQKTITVPYWGTFLRPTVNFGGVVNAAGFTSSPIPVAAGSLISIFGTDLANATATATVIPLLKSVGGTRVTIRGTAAPVLYASPLQVNVQVPVELAGRPFAEVVVHLNGVSSPPVSVSLAAAAPGIFTVTQDGNRVGAILHASDSRPVTSTHPARPGEILEVYATGLGRTVPTVPNAPAVPTGSPAPTSPLYTTEIAPSATIAGIPARVHFSGLAPALVGLYQINVEVPASVPTGALPLVLTANGLNSNAVTVFVAP
ncbi:MAG: S8 family serine peptidase [Acidobacteria bacterium]|nr:S8 family serine peptidase [Acidobacteriota bacterium]